MIPTVRILIADDDRTVLRLITAALADLEHAQIVTVDNGADALAEILGQAPPDLALLDWLMPRESGLSICKKVRQVAFPQYCYLILMTAKREEGSLEAAFQAGADDYLAKPIVRAELLARIRAGCRVIEAQRSLERANAKLWSIMEELEERVEHRTAELYRAKEEAELASRVKSEFIANMSHEIRTPLHGVMSMLELVTETSLLPQQREDIATAQSCARSLHQLLSNLLDLAKLEAKRVDLETTPTRVRQVVSDALDAIRGDSIQKHIEVHSTIAAELPEWIGLDAFRYQQILLNLLSNAVKFSPRGGRISVATVFENREEGGGSLGCEVSDTGCGIDQNKLESIFNPFTQGDSSTTRRFGGTGLGLSIARELARLMGGDITVKSSPGAGSAFRITIPCREVAPPTLVVPARNALPVPPGTRVLVVDDNEVSRRALARKLRQAGFDVDATGNAREAQQKLRSDTFHLALLDIQMPEMSGDEIAAFVRNEPGPNQEIPLVAVSAHVTAEDAARVIRAGMSCHIPKPIDYSRLFSTISDLLKGEHHGRLVSL